MASVDLTRAELHYLKQLVKVQSVAPTVDLHELYGKLNVAWANTRPPKQA